MGVGSVALSSYMPVAVFVVVALLFAFVTLLLSRWFSPSAPNPKKLATYECGEIPEGAAMIQFHFQYYIFALVFVIFDVVSVFLILWAMAFSTLALSSRLLMGVFVGILVVGLGYVLRKEVMMKV